MSSLNDQHLGLVALAASGEKRWFFGHVGAGLLALDRLKTYDSSAELAPALDQYRGKAKTFVEESEMRASLTPGGAAVDDWRERLGAALVPHTKVLRNSGHGTIYITWAIRILSSSPDLATEPVVAGLEALAQSALNEDKSRYLSIRDHDRIYYDDAEVPTSETDRVASAFHAALPQFQDLETSERTYFLTGSKIHVLTYLHALMELQHFGFDDLHDAGISRWWKHLQLCRAMELVAKDYGAAAWSYPEGTTDPYAKVHEDPHAYKYRAAALDLLASDANSDRSALKSVMDRMQWVWAP